MDSKVINSNIDVMKSIIRRKKKITPFIGAGVSIACGLMDWPTLAYEFAGEHLKPGQMKGIKKLSPIKIADKVFEKAAKGDPAIENGLYTSLAQKIESKTINTAGCKYIPILVNKFGDTLITTNYDACIEKIINDNNQLDFITSPDTKELTIKLQEGSHCLVHLHGSSRKPYSMIFESKRYEALYGSDLDSKLAQFLVKVYSTSSALFVGCSLEEANDDKTLGVLKKVIHNDNDLIHFAILEYPGSIAKWTERKNELLNWGIHAVFFPQKRFDLIYNILFAVSNYTEEELDGISIFEDNTINPKDELDHNIKLDSTKSIIDKIESDKTNTDPVLKTFYQTFQYKHLDGVYSECTEKKEFNLAKNVLESFLSTDDNKRATFEELCRSFETQGKEKISIIGLPGTGKSTLLSLIYCYYAKFNYASRIYPLIIDLHQYASSKSNIVKSFQNDLMKISDFIGQKKHEYRFVICIDGIDNFNSIVRKQLSDSIANFIIQYSDLPQIYCVSENDNERPRGIVPDDKLGKVISKTNKIFKLDRITINLEESNTEFDQVLKNLLLLKQPKGSMPHKIDVIKNSIKSYGMKTIDYRTLLLYMNTSIEKNTKSINLAQIITSHYLKGKMNFNKASIDAYEYEILSKDSTDYSYLIRKNDVVREFLVAYYLLSFFSDDDLLKQKNIISENNSILNSISNKLFIDLFSVENPGTQSRIIKNMIKALKSEDISVSMKAQICYFLGRLDNDGTEKIRKETLKAEWDILHKTIFADSIIKFQAGHEFLIKLLCFRTISISLIILGGFDNTFSQEDFLKCILYNETFSNLNRGFHIAYYSDKEYKNGDQPLLLDDGKLDATRTMKHLKDSIYKWLNDPENSSKLINLNIITLYSFYQTRLSDSRMVVTYSKELNTIAQKILKNDCEVLPIVKKYIRMMLYFINNQKVSPKQKVINDLNRFKTLKRAGWVRRGIQEPESIADHVLGTLYFALFFLPDNISCCEYQTDALKEDYSEYSKTKILNHLLVHDFGEYFKGDIITMEKDNQDDLDERGAAEFYECFGSFSRLYGLGENATNCYQMLEKENKDINVLIAKDIDIIERVIQSYHYWKQQDREEVWKEFLGDYSLLNSDLGRLIWKETISAMN